MRNESYWQKVWHRFYGNLLGRFALYVIILFCLIGIYAPFLASSKPIFLTYEGNAYFPLFRYLFYTGFYTKYLDIFFNLMIFTFPLFLMGFWFSKIKKIWIVTIFCIQIFGMIWLIVFPINDPAADPKLIQKRLMQINQLRLEGKEVPLDWPFDLQFMTPYAKLNLLLKERHNDVQHQKMLRYLNDYVDYKRKALDKEAPETLPTLWQVAQDHEKKEIELLSKQNTPESQIQLHYLLDRRHWIDQNSKLIHHEINPFLSTFHWEDDAGGQQALNQFVHWWELTRINRKDLLAALIFGVRISLVVGLASVALSLLIGIPIGALAGYYGGTWDIIVSRLLEIWEAMPVFFMLLMAVGILQTKSIFLVILIIGFFGWTGFSRYIRGEFFKQRNLPYVEACRALGFHDRLIIFKHVLPNAIPPVLTLLPFAMMGAISSEAGLSFLGLGEEGSCSWGVLMDEGRNAFPQESELLWPPAILLIILLVAMAIVGDRLRDTLDPKLLR